jgi:hypothetical protein
MPNDVARPDDKQVPVLGIALLRYAAEQVLPASGRRQAQPSREFSPGAERAGSGTVAARAVAIMGPMPGRTAASLSDDLSRLTLDSVDLPDSSDEEPRPSSR